jgi:glutamate formiminotransferase/formiminotetrahydrofolate cyclodeaminase
MDQTDTESEHRKDQAIQEALNRTISVPLSVAKECVALLKLAIKVADKGNVNVITDAGVAALMADTALKGALFNVRINLKSIKDLNMKSELTDSVKQLMKEGEDYRNRALAIVEAKVG